MRRCKETASGDNKVKVGDFVSVSCTLTFADHTHQVKESIFLRSGNFLN